MFLSDAWLYLEMILDATHVLKIEENDFNVKSSKKGVHKKTS